MEYQWPSGGNTLSGPSTQQVTQKKRRAASPIDLTRESVDLTQEEVEDGREDSPPPELDEHYVTCRTDVVGIQYYQGLVGTGEYVMLRRQPENQYDANAVQVLNANNIQVGHIPRGVASRIAYLMDNRLITVEGRMIGQNIDHSRHYKLAMDMSIYARPSHREALEPELAWATPGGLGFDNMRALQARGTDVRSSPAKGKGKGKGRTVGDTGVEGRGGGSGSGLPEGNEEEMRAILDGLKKVGEDEKQADGVMNALTADIDVSRLPLHPSPPGLANGDLMVDLLPHQSQALQWMIERENPVLPKTPEDPAVQFWTRQKDKTSEYWLNVATRTPQAQAPDLGRGGIIADGMGLGKTLTTLSLVLATKAGERGTTGSRATLIVCPLSVLSNWEKQIQDHVAEGKLTSYTYHGAAKGVTAATLGEYDVILTTYQTVAADAPSEVVSASQAKGKKHKSSTGPLFKVKWKRVVADEGHVLKNPKAKMTMAFAGLEAERRWICTGTPIVNSPSDLGSLLSCVQVCKPLDQAAYFKSLLLRPLKNGDRTAGKLLQALVGQILLRRTKDSKDKDGQRLVELPSIEYFQVPITLDDETRAIYNEVQEASRKRFEDAMRTGENTANVLAMLTRLRQLCLSSELVPQSFLEDMRKPVDAGTGPSVSIVSIPLEKREALIEKLRAALADSEECSICFDTFTDPRITDCGHAFCLYCITMVCEVQRKCPMCRHSITTASLLDLPPDTKPTIDLDEDLDVKPVKSAKIRELIRYLKAFKGDDKTLVFSQFTGFLDRVAASLKEEGILYCRFDGSMIAKRRQEVIREFQIPVTATNQKTNPKVMLISLKSGAVGLNLTAASNVFLCDPWWQSAIEAQAIDRAHRLGQKKNVRVFQLIAEDTIESKVLDIQKRKDALVAQAFEKSSKETKQDKKQARFEELKEIFGMR